MHENLVFVCKKIQDKWWQSMPVTLYSDTTWVWILVTSLMFLPLMLVKELKHLTKFSMLGFMNIVYLTVIIVAYSFDESVTTMQESLKKITYYKVI
jgi:amino acid permease